MEKFNKRFGSNHQFIPVKNEFFGGRVNVTGLLTAGDMLKALPEGKHLILPAVAVILAVVFMFCFNFNLGIDFNGGTVATVVFEQDLNEGNNYKNLKRIL